MTSGKAVSATPFNLWRIDFPTCLVLGNLCVWYFWITFVFSVVLKCLFFSFHLISTFGQNQYGSGHSKVREALTTMADRQQVGRIVLHPQEF